MPAVHQGKGAGKWRPFKGGGRVPRHRFKRVSRTNFPRFIVLRLEAGATFISKLSGPDAVIVAEAKSHPEERFRPSVSGLCGSATFPPSGSRSADAEGVPVDSSSLSLSVAGRSHFVCGNRGQRLCLQVWDLTAAITHLDTSIHLSSLTTTSDKDTTVSQRHTRRLTSPSGQGRQTCSQTSGRQKTATRRSHPRP